MQGRVKMALGPFPVVRVADRIEDAHADLDIDAPDGFHRIPVGAGKLRIAAIGIQGEDDHPLGAVQDGFEEGGFFARDFFRCRQFLLHPPFLLEQIPLAQDALHRARHIVKSLGGFDQVVERARLHRRHGDLLVAHAGHDQSRKRAVHRQQAQRFIGVTVWQVEVQKSDVRRPRVHHFAVFPQAGSHPDLRRLTGRFKGTPDRLGVGRVVFKDEKGNGIHSGYSCKGGRRRFSGWGAVPSSSV